MSSAMPSDQAFHVQQMAETKAEIAEAKQYIKKVNQMSGWVSTAAGDKYESIRQSGTIKRIDEKVINMAVDTLREINEKRKNA